jgi:hypothetical protein
MHLLVAHVKVMSAVVITSSIRYRGSAHHEPAVSPRVAPLGHARPPAHGVLAARPETPYPRAARTPSRMDSIVNPLAL